MSNGPAEFTPFPHFGTDAIHVGQEPEQWESRAVVPPISLATTFKQKGPGELIAVSKLYTNSTVIHSSTLTLSLSALSVNVTFI